MQQALYNTTATTPAINPVRQTAQPGAGMVRWIARNWDMVGVLALLGSSAAYGVFALAHTGL